MIALLAQAPPAQTIAAWAIYGVIIVGIVAILLAFAQHAGVSIPPLFVKVAWIIIAVLFVVFAIKLLVGAL